MDEGAERLLLAAMAEGYWPREKVSPSDFHFTFHRDVAEALAAARAIDVKPTIQSLARSVEALGASGPHIETGIEVLIYETPTVVHVDELAHHIRRLAWLRRMVAVTDRLRAHLVEPAIEDHAIEAAIDAVVAMSAARPNSARSE
jgi:replicative DNA helicase